MPEARDARDDRDAPATEATSGAEEPVPKLPRGKGLTMSRAQMMRIGMTMVTLLAIVALQKPCSNAVGTFVTTFGGTAETGQGGAAATAETGQGGAGATTRPGPGPGIAPAPSAAGGTGAAAPPPAVRSIDQYERLTPSMTDAELRAAIERARRRAAEAEAASSPGPTPGAAGTAGSPAAPSGGAAGPSPSPVVPPKER